STPPLAPTTKQSKSSGSKKSTSASNPSAAAAIMDVLGDSSISGGTTDSSEQQQSTTISSGMSDEQQQQQPIAAKKQSVIDHVPVFCSMVQNKNFVEALELYKTEVASLPQQEERAKFLNDVSCQDMTPLMHIIVQKSDASAQLFNALTKDQAIDFTQNGKYQGLPVNALCLCFLTKNMFALTTLLGLGPRINIMQCPAKWGTPLFLAIQSCDMNAFKAYMTACESHNVLQDAINGM